MLVSPSILSADFAHLDREIAMLNDSAADMIHIDVMDGVFVPNISVGFPIIEAVRRLSRKPLDVHLMIVEPHKYVDRLAGIGVDIVNVHQEACVHLDRTVSAIIDAGMKPAVTLNPATPVEMLRDIIGKLHMVLLMSVNPGYGGQKFIPYTVEKVARMRRLISEEDAQALIEVDGGINAETARLVADAGADIVVAGNAVFSAPSPTDAILTLKNI